MSNEVTVDVIKGNLMPALIQNGIEDLLPDHVSVETFARLAAVAIFNNPMLGEADQNSVINSLILSAKDGLICDGREAAMVPFKTKDNGRYITKAQYMPMVDGVLKRVRQSGQVSVIASKSVFENDQFEFWSDEDGDHFKHVPTLGEPGDLIAVIAYAKMNDGTRHIELLRRWEIDRVRNESKQGNNEYGPWKKWFDRMACKTGLHRVARRLPNSSEIMEMLERGDHMNFGREEKDITPQPEQQTGNAAIDSLLVEDDFEKVQELDQEQYAKLVDSIKSTETLDAFASVMDVAKDISVSELQSKELRKVATEQKKKLTTTDFN